MSDLRNFLEIATKYLYSKSSAVSEPKTWCAWTTFERLGSDAGYWIGPLPLEEELLSNSIADGGAWGQPFSYDQIAHVIIPGQFYWERISEEGFVSGINKQDIQGLSERLSVQDVPHRLGKLVLELKFY